MKLFYFPGACSLVTHIVLREVGAAFVLAPVDLRTKTLSDGSDYLAINGKGQVPALILDDGTLLTENAIIAQYLADQNPATELLPAPGPTRYHVLEWVNFIATELHKGLSPLRLPDLPQVLRTQFRARVHLKLSIVDQALTDCDYLVGNHPSIADIYLFVVLSWIPHLEFSLGEFPALNALVSRLAERPSVVAALAAEGAPTHPRDG